MGMLTGHCGKNRVRELPKRLYLDGESGEIEAAPGTALLLYTSGGVIANRGYYSLRLASGVKVGELDEEFVWERRLGDSFEFGNRSWTITAIGAEAVTAIPSENSVDIAPFFKGDSPFRSPVLGRRILEILDRFDASPRTLPPSFSPEAGEDLAGFLALQQMAQGGASLPGAAHVPVEMVEDPLSRSGTLPVIFHSFRGGALNQPLAMILAQSLEDRTGHRIETIADDNAILIMLPIRAALPVWATLPVREGIPDPVDGDLEALFREVFRDLAGRTRGEDLFRRRLAASGIFGASFREAAERAALLTKGGPGRRMPLWIMRERSRRLFDAVAGFDDFPVTTEAWRECLEDRFDLPGLAAFLRDLADGTVGLSFFRRPGPTPFARGILWKLTNDLMYADDGRKDLRGAARSEERRVG
jgi:ATP-dependent Lhr-like helicase